MLKSQTNPQLQKQINLISTASHDSHVSKG